MTVLDFTPDLALVLFVLGSAVALLVSAITPNRK